MSTITLSDLLTPYTQTTLRSIQYSVLATGGFPVTSWHSTSVPYVLAEANIACVLDVANLIPQIAAGGLLDLATGDWLSLLAEQNYDVTRTPEKFCRRIVRLTNDSGSTVAEAASSVIVATAAGLQFLTEQSIDILAGDAAYVIVRAEIAGDSYNDATASWTLVTSIAGVTVDELNSEPAIITLGSDAESDESLRARCHEKWSALGAGANHDAYKFWIKNAPGSPEIVTRVKVVAASPLPGQVTAYAATATGPISSTATLGTVTQSGSGPAVTLSGTPTESVLGRVEILTGGARGVATFRYTTDGENYIGALTTAATYALGTTGVTLNFAVGTYVANENYQWTSTPATTDVIQEYIDPATHLGLAPQCTDFFISAATSYSVAPVGTIYVSNAQYKPAVEAARGAVISDVCESVDIGGMLYVESIRHALMKLPGVVNVTISTPAADVILSASQVAVSGAITGLTVSVI